MKQLVWSVDYCKIHSSSASHLFELLIREIDVVFSICEGETILLEDST